MKYLKPIVAVLVLMIAATGGAWADHRHDRRHFRSHVYIGVGPYWGPSYYYPPPAYYYPPSIVYSSPPVYIEQSPSPESSSGGYWYYCAASKRYYPYVTECPAGWQLVTPTPPDAR